MKYTPCLQWPNCSRSICPFRHPELNPNLPVQITMSAPSPPAQGLNQFPHQMLPPGPHAYAPPLAIYTPPASQYTQPLYPGPTRTAEYNDTSWFAGQTPFSPFSPEPQRHLGLEPTSFPFTTRQDPSAGWANYAIVVSPTTPAPLRSLTPTPLVDEYDRDSTFPFRIRPAHVPHMNLTPGHGRRLSVSVSTGSLGPKLETARLRFKSAIKLPTTLEVLESKAKRNVRCSVSFLRELKMLIVIVL
jgi:hypothetical protein